nr:MAG TPA: hypothetical protein [Caudoviricetes sp.]
MLVNKFYLSPFTSSRSTVKKGIFRCLSKEINL